VSQDCILENQQELNSSLIAMSATLIQLSVRLLKLHMDFLFVVFMSSKDLLLSEDLTKKPTKLSLLKKK